MSGIPCILVTRPEPEATATARMLEAAGYETHCFPVLTIAPRKEATKFIEQAIAQGIQAIALTSKRSFDALLPFPQTKHIPLFVVGSASAEQAKALGFQSVIEGDGNAKSLVESILSHGLPKDGNILYLRGETVSTDIAASLEEYGYNPLEVIAYSTAPADHLPEALIGEIRSGEIHAIATYSRDSLKHLMQLIEKYALTEALNRINLLCLSASIAEIAIPCLWQKVTCAETPEEAAMLEAFKRLYGDPPRITTGA